MSGIIRLRPRAEALRQPGRLRETRGFPSPPRDGFGFVTTCGTLKLGYHVYYKVVLKTLKNSAFLDE